jgi:hypothetical protein
MAMAIFRHRIEPLMATDPRAVREPEEAVYACEHAEHSALLCHRHRPGPHLVGMASGSLGHRFKACCCACTEMAQGRPPWVAEALS